MSEKPKFSKSKLTNLADAYRSLEKSESKYTIKQIGDGLSKYAGEDFDNLIFHNSPPKVVNIFASDNQTVRMTAAGVGITNWYLPNATSVVNGTNRETLYSDSSAGAIQSPFYNNEASLQEYQIKVLYLPKCKSINGPSREIEGVDPVVGPIADHALFGNFGVSAKYNLNSLESTAATAFRRYSFKGCPTVCLPNIQTKNGGGGGYGQTSIILDSDVKNIYMPKFIQMDAHATFYNHINMAEDSQLKNVYVPLMFAELRSYGRLIIHESYSNNTMEEIGFASIFSDGSLNLANSPAIVGFTALKRVILLDDQHYFNIVWNEYPNVDENAKKLLLYRSYMLDHLDEPDCGIFVPDEMVSHYINDDLETKNRWRNFLPDKINKLFKPLSAARELGLNPDKYRAGLTYEQFKQEFNIPEDEDPVIKSDEEALRLIREQGGN